ncbi:MAG: glycoside hydrolase [Desulfurococcaceae archaeon]
MKGSDLGWQLRRVGMTLALLALFLAFLSWGAGGWDAFRTAAASSQGEPITVDGLGYDWRYENCVALSPARDHYQYYGYYADSRDLVALYYAVGRSYAYFRVDLLDLAYGAESYDPSYGKGLSVYLLIGWQGAPQYQGWLPDFVQYQGKGVYLDDYQWVLAIAIYGTNYYRVYDPSWKVLVENTSLLVAFNAQYDLIEIGVPVDLLARHGWTYTTRVWMRAATTYTPPGGLPQLSDGIPHVQLAVDEGAAHWRGAVFSDQRCPTAKFAVLHHANQHIADNRALNNPSSANSYGYVLWVHENLTYLTGRPVPVDIHMSGTLIASYLWWDPGFINYVRSLVSKGIAHIVGGLWAEYVTAYFYDNFNGPSALLGKGYLKYVFGVSPEIAWIPERTWDDDRTGIAWTLSKYYTAVVLDANTHHDDWMPGSNPYKPHLYDLSRTSGRELFVFFISWDAQQELLAPTDGGLNYDLRLLLLGKALDWDQQQLVLYADDWEKAAGIAGWPSSGPFNYEMAMRWIAMHPWIQVVSLEDVLYWLKSGYWAPVTGYYCGYDTYIFIKQWVGDYPYDPRRSYDGWYWGTPTKKAFARYGDPSDAAYALPDTLMPFGDVFGYTSYRGSPNNTVIYRLLSPGGALDQAPRNELWELAVMVADAMLYETAWHEGSDVASWGLNLWNHLRHVNVLLMAAGWLNGARAGKIDGYAVLLGDFDFDGTTEAVVYGPSIFAWVDDKGGSIPLLITYNRTADNVAVLVGNLPAYWWVKNDQWLNSGHVALFVDDYFTATGKNYYATPYRVVGYSATRYGATITLSPPGNEFVKTYVINDASINVQYIANIPGTLYVGVGFTLNLTRALYDGDFLKKLSAPQGQNSFGFYDVGAALIVKPLANSYWTGAQDLLKLDLAYQAKLRADLRPGDVATIQASLKLAELESSATSTSTTPTPTSTPSQTPTTLPATTTTTSAMTSSLTTSGLTTGSGASLTTSMSPTTTSEGVASTTPSNTSAAPPTTQFPEHGGSATSSQTSAASSASTSPFGGSTTAGQITTPRPWSSPMATRPSSRSNSSGISQPSTSPTSGTPASTGPRGTIVTTFPSPTFGASGGAQVNYRLAIVAFLLSVAISVLLSLSRITKRRTE